MKSCYTLYRRKTDKLKPSKLISKIKKYYFSNTRYIILKVGSTIRRF